ncbi:aldehyde dehydrogenase family protein, partial [Rhodococcus sp. NPDC058514]
AALVGKVIAEETEIPAGVVNIVTSTDHALGAQLCTDPRVDLVSFTGSTATGRAVMAASSESLKKVFLELGGKSAFIVLDDADIKAACSMAAFSVSVHAGQGCALCTRLLVPREKYDEAVAAAAAAMAGVRAGDPTKPGTICGPLISAKQRDRVESYLKLAIEEGGTFVIGGGRPEGYDSGFFVEPTLIAGLDNSARVAQEEIFGPVLVILPYDSDEDAIAIANDSPYGLSGAVWGTDPERIERVVAGVRTGTLGVNGGLWYSVDAPFGGYKQSGIGREMGVAGFEEYLETKLVAGPATS